MTKLINVEMNVDEFNMILVALMEKARSCEKGSEARQRYEMLYGDLQESVCNGTCIS